MGPTCTDKQNALVDRLQKAENAWNNATYTCKDRLLQQMVPTKPGPKPTAVAAAGAEPDASVKVQVTGPPVCKLAAKWKAYLDYDFKKEFAASTWGDCTTL